MTTTTDTMVQIPGGEFAMGSDDFYQDEEFAPLLLEEPTVTGVEALGDWAMTIRIMVKTKPGKQWDVARELRRRVKESFEREGIEMPYPRQEVLMRPPAE